MRIPASALALALAVLYAGALLGKVTHRHKFATYLRPLTRALTDGIVGGVLVLEGLLAASLAAVAAGLPITDVAGWASALFICLATGFYGVLLVRGQSAACHCFGIEHPRSGELLQGIEPALLGARNCAIIGASLTIARVSSTASLVAVGALAAGLICALVLSITRERRLIGAPNHPLVDEYAPQIGRIQAHSWWMDGAPRPL